MTTEEARQKVRELKRLVDYLHGEAARHPTTVKCRMTGAIHVATWTLPLRRSQSCSVTAIAPPGSGKKRKAEAEALARREFKWEALLKMGREMGRNLAPAPDSR